MSQRLPVSSKAYAIFPIYLPWLLSIALQLLPELSYLVAWLGSFFIFYFSMHFPGYSLDKSVLRRKQMMKPIILIQIIFAGFMCCSSIFFFLDYHGYHFFKHTSDLTDPPEEQIYRIAKCQRLCLLAHCALVTGIIFVTPSPLKPKYTLRIQNQILLVALSIISFLLSIFFNFFTGTAQLGLLFSNLSLFSGTALFINAIKERNLFGLLLGAFIFLYSLGANLFTGYKESIIVHFILLSFLIYPVYPKTVRIFSIPIIIGIFTFLPSFTKAIRQRIWTEHHKLSYFKHVTDLSIVDGQTENLAENNWEFLSYRFSEIGMFTQFIKKVPEERPYYGWGIIGNAIQALIPRIIWPDKPNTEKVAMRRIYELGVANPSSNVSAKSRPVVDGYLSAGPPGVFMLIFAYGYLAQSICNTATRWFANETIGCAVIFNGLFQQLWRGNNLEFILNNIIYGTLLMTFIFYLLRICGILIPQQT